MYGVQFCIVVSNANKYLNSSVYTLRMRDDPKFGALFTRVITCACKTIHVFENVSIARYVSNIFLENSIQIYLPQMNLAPIHW
jgi:hypothetical protein